MSVKEEEFYEEFVDIDPDGKVSKIKEALQNTKEKLEIKWTGRFD